MENQTSPSSQRPKSSSATNSEEVTTTPRTRGIQGEKWTAKEEEKLKSLYFEFRAQSANTYSKDIWVPISELMSGRKSDACHQKAYRMGLLGNQAPRITVPKEPRVTKRKQAAVTNERPVDYGHQGSYVPRVTKRKQATVINERPIDYGDLSGHLSGYLGGLASDREAVTALKPAPASVVPDLERHARNAVVEPQREKSPVFTGPDAWKHDKASVEGKAHRQRRHAAYVKMRQGVHKDALKNLCSPNCEGCHAEGRYR